MATIWHKRAYESNQAFLLQYSFIKDFKTSTLRKCLAKLTNNSLTKHPAKYATLLLLLLVTSFIYYAIYTRPNSIQKIEQTHVENALFNEKKNFQQVPVNCLFFIINDVKRKKCLSSGRKIISAMKSYIIWENQWDNYVFFLFFFFKREKLVS